MSFSYNKDKPVIRNVNIKISQGQVVALVGPSGAGKSTLFSLLLRFIKPNQGSLYFDGNDIYKLRSNDLRKQVAIVPQRITVFSGSINEKCNLPLS